MHQAAHEPSASPTRQLFLIAAVQVMAMATWFSMSAVVPTVRAEWDMSAGAATWLTASVQLGFVAGAVASATLNLPDRVPAHRLVGISAAVAAAMTVLAAILADGLVLAVPLRFLTGVALAGVYPPGLKLMASWFDRGRGLALGVLVGSLTLGSALPHLISGAGNLPWQGVLLVSSFLAALSALIAVRYLRLGPNARPAPPFMPRYVLMLFRERGPRLANLGYFGHMWELYAMWTWLPAYLAASQVARDGPAGSSIGVTAFLAIGIAGVVGCLLAGAVGDRIGRARTAAAAMIISGSCCLLAALVFGGPPILVGLVVTLWGASIIADSGLFSTCMTEVVDRRYVGTALTAQTAIGFLLTVVTIQAVPLVVEWVGWRTAVGMLALGPIAGAVAMMRLHEALTPSREGRLA